ncbi:patatin-like protein [Streptomyces sp. NPDC048696]|uniref:patatin-like protein n=1 Tax=Streptomyces sp. NPDC048696 TaxID=3365585 RepID=UPI00371A09B5
MDVTPVNGRTQEIRIATAMTGGVSLAIWMGGVARELNLLQQAAWRRHPPANGDFVADLGEPSDPQGRVRDLYVRLLDLLDTTVSIDVLSGTSAGGINGVLLGLARVNAFDLGPLREFWLTSGAFETLLRDPKEQNPPSLLRGDGVLFKKLLNGLERLEPTEVLYRPPTSVLEPDPPTDVFVTTTLLTGETSRFTDAFGTLVQDVDHHGLFAFDEKQLKGAAAFGPVSLAARCSASYPLAFEPAFVPFEKEILAVPAKGILRHPGMKPYTDITRDHWVADGGLLANRPIGPLLQAVFDRPAERQVRRVLLYVVPSPGQAPDPRRAPALRESFDAPWTLGEALLKDLGSVLNQSISADLKALRRHNDRVDSLRDTRLRMAELGTRLADCEPPSEELPGYRLLTRTMLADYRVREATWLVEPVLAALMRAVTTMPEERMPGGWRTALAPGRSAEEECRTAAASAIAAEWELPDRSGLDGLVKFGRPAYDGAKATVLAMLQAAYVCDPGRWTALGALNKQVHEAFIAGERPRVDKLVENELKGFAGDDGDQRTLPELAESLAVQYAGLLATPAPSAPAPRSLEDGWQDLSDVVNQLRGYARSGGAPVGADAFPPQSMDQRRQNAAAELATYVHFLSGGIDPYDADHAIAFRLFELHVATRSVLPVNLTVEQPVELIQVSADTRGVLTPRRATAASKLTGLQLFHFGAFYKSSWRANDWAWGRLDGAGWIVHLLLDPRRVQALAEFHAPTGTVPRSQWFYERLRDEVLDGTEPRGWPVEAAGEAAVRLDREAVIAELGFLDDPAAAMPTCLPLTAMWAAYSWQRWIAAEELPVVARHVLSTPSTRHSPWAVDVLETAGQSDRAVAAAQAAASAVLTRKWSPEQNKLIAAALATSAAETRPVATAATADAIAARLADCPVPDETFADELGEPLFTRTVTKAFATAMATATAVKKAPASVQPLLTSARTVAMTGYRASGLFGGAPRALTLTGLVCVAIGVAAMILGARVLSLGGAVITAIGVYLIALAAWGLSRRLVPALVGLLVVALVAAMSVRRKSLFGTGACKAKCTGADIGWVGRHTLPWLQSAWWHPLVALIALGVAGLLLSGGIGRAVRALRHRPDRDPGGPVPARQ